MENREPWTRDEILAALAEAESRVARFFRGLTDAEFVESVDGGWSPAQHLEHLNRSVGAVAQGLAVPRWLLRLRFGRPPGASRRFSQLRETYRDKLAQGGRASGRFVPPTPPSPDEVSRARTDLLARWQRRNLRLRSAVERWPDAALDRVALPHPLLGPLTTREMLFFTIYHNVHHVEAATRRLPRLRDSAS